MQKAAGSLMDTITKVLGASPADDRVDHLQKELEKVQIKKERLLELYLSGDIVKADFQKAQVKVEDEIRLVQRELNRVSGKENPQSGQLETMTRITISAIASGEEWDDTFYRHLLDGMMVGGDGNLQIMLNLLRCAGISAALRAAVIPIRQSGHR